MKNVAFCDIKTQLIPHRKQHYVSDAEPNRLMLCKMRFSRPVTMKNVVFWDIKTQFIPNRKQHYVSATEPSRLMLCKI
jgi:hypothetical protein